MSLASEASIAGHALRSDAWLKEGENEIVVFDLKGNPDATVSGLDHPILDGPVKAAD